jgi:hypothetical protein
MELDIASHRLCRIVGINRKITREIIEKVPLIEIMSE